MGISYQPGSMTQLVAVPVVINWHLTEACNYACRYCYAHWERAESVRDLFKSDTRVQALVAELARFFGSSEFAAKYGFNQARPRLNIAGGEPLLSPHAVLAAAR